MQIQFNSDIKYVGVDDDTLDLFENQYPLPKGSCLLLMNKV